jgi:ABC-type maltose transport system permease subunit
VSHAAKVLAVLLVVAVVVAGCVTWAMGRTRPSRRRGFLSFVVILVVVVFIMAVLIALFLWANWSSMTG